MIVVKGSPKVMDTLKHHGAQTSEIEIGTHAVTFNKEEALPTKRVTKKEKVAKKVASKLEKREKAIDKNKKAAEHMTVVELFQKRRISCAKCKVHIEYAKDIITKDTKGRPVINCKCGHTRTLMTATF